MTVAALRHRPAAVVVTAISSSVFLRRRRRAAVRLSIPTAMTTRTMTRTTTRTMTTAPAADRSPPAAAAARSIVGFPRKGGGHRVRR